MHAPELPPPELQELDAWVESFDAYGNVTVKFSSEINQFNLSLLNQSVCDIYLQTWNDWQLDKSEFNLTSLNFSWSATNVSKDELKLKLVFLDTL